MANANVSFGLKPVGKHGSSPATQGTSQYFIASDASAIFQGSPVRAELTGGTIQIATATCDGVQLLGVFAGCEYVDATTGKLKFSNTWPEVGQLILTLTSKGLCMMIHHRDLLSQVMEQTLTEQLLKLTFLRC